MPRKPVISRTMNTTVTTILYVDIANQTTAEKTVRIPRTYKTEKQLLRKLRQIYDDDSIKVVHIIESRPETVKCKLTEQQYLNAAEIEVVKENNENE